MTTDLVHIIPRLHVELGDALLLLMEVLFMEN